MARPEEAGEAFAALADACISALAPEAIAETIRLGGALAGGEACVVALGKAGSREMTAGSDLDLMTVYDAPADATSDKRGWGGDTWFSRFTQRLVAALSAPTAEGELYEVDMRLRPSGTAGPVAVKLSALDHYYASEAQTWEFLALSRARIIWASSPEFGARTKASLNKALRQVRDPVQARMDIANMRALMRKERPAKGFWDLKLADGGMVDVEFAAQTLQILGAAEGCELTVSTPHAIEAAQGEGRLSAEQAQALTAGWRLHQSLSQLLKLALTDTTDPAAEPDSFKALLAQAGGAADFDALVARMETARAATLAVCDSVFGRVQSSAQ
jgi:glutamate-ammonia-ligase adenylyltransferase